MPDNLNANHFHKARTEAFEHTISGLLTKRSDLITEATHLRDRIAEIRNDLGSLDRTLDVLGYKGDLDAMMPRKKREVVFGRGELSKAIFDELRHATEPMASREIAREIIALRGEDARDRRYLTELTRRVSKALRQMKHDGDVTSSVDLKGNYLWEKAKIK